MPATLPARGADVTARGRLWYDDSSLAPAGLEAACATPPWPRLDVRDFGAVGDGAADDTPAFRAAVAACPAAGGTVYIPAGTYNLCPQASDPVTAGQPVLKLARGNLCFQGEGAGTSVLRFRCLGNTDPAVTWRVIGDGTGYQKISRGCLFSFDWGNPTPRGPMAGLQIRSLTLDGGCPYTGNSTVGGVPATGDGWDLSHKALLCNGPVGGVLVFNCDVKNWRGECLYAGGNVADFTAVNTWVHGSNASAVSCSATFVSDHVTVGGPNPGDDVYNGYENFAFTPGQSTAIRDGVIQTSSAGLRAPRGYGAALLGVPGTKTAVLNCLFTNCGHAVLASEVLSALTLQANDFKGCGGGVITSILGNYPQFPTGFDGWVLAANGSDAGGVFLNVQSHGPGPVSPLVLLGNTLTTSGVLLAGGFGTVLPQQFRVTGTTFGVGTSDTKNQPYTGARAVWSGTVRPPGTGSMPAANDYGAASTQMTVAPTSDAFCLNDVKNTAVPHYAVIDPATLGLYPPGYAVTFYQGPARRNWLLKADPAWNTLPADLPVTAAGVTLVYDGAKFNPK